MAHALDRLRTHAGRHDAPARAEQDVLEACASLVGRFSLDVYRETFVEARVLPAATALDVATQVIESFPPDINPVLAIATLSESTRSDLGDRWVGAYQTDARLAAALAERVTAGLPAGVTVLDPAAGTGMLLAASGLVLCGDDRGALREYVRSGANAADLSPEALRGCRLTLAALAGDIASARDFWARCLVGDSLVDGPGHWRTHYPDGVDVVIANPPWERIRVTRHEHLTQLGDDRHYGSDYSEVGEAETNALEDRKESVRSYLDRIRALYETPAAGDVDYYQLFIELALRLVRRAGRLGFIVPAGLARSQGSAPLRKRLIEASSVLSMTTYDNRPRYFSIDTRFKFLLVRADLARTTSSVVEFGTGGGPIQPKPVIAVDQPTLQRVRPLLDPPEVSSVEAWQLFSRLVINGKPMADAPWAPRFSRELDMTRDRPLLSREEIGLPVVEGRMVHQFRFPAKSFVSGSGRRAVWRPTFDRNPRPQFYVASDRLSAELNQRVQQERLGFCDVSGQTNERTMMAAAIPSGVVCGNKVPTVRRQDFAAVPDWIGDAWLAVTNSLVFDWLLRRVVTTTVNYFILHGMPMPDVSIGRRDWTQVADLAAKVTVSGRLDWSSGVLRARMDALVARMYGLTADDLEFILGDFPLLDRGQPSPPGERPTVTRDLVMLEFLRAESGADLSRHNIRVELARRLGAVPYVPADHSAPPVETSDSLMALTIDGAGQARIAESALAAP